MPGKLRKKFAKISKGKYDLEKLHQYLLGIKKSNLNEKTIIFEPIYDLSYDGIIKIMDAVRLLRNTDPAFYRKEKGGVNVRVSELFNNIIFGNIQS